MRDLSFAKTDLEILRSISDNAGSSFLRQLTINNSSCSSTYLPFTSAGNNCTQMWLVAHFHRYFQREAIRFVLPGKGWNGRRLAARCGLRLIRVHAWALRASCSLRQGSCEQNSARYRQRERWRQRHRGNRLPPAVRVTGRITGLTVPVMRGGFQIGRTIGEC